MPQQTDSASRTRLCKISDDLVGRKLRVAGRLNCVLRSLHGYVLTEALYRVLSYDFTTGLIVLVDGANGLLVDISLSLDSQTSVWARDRLSTIMAIGDLEHSEVSVFHEGWKSQSCLFLNSRSHLRLQLGPHTRDHSGSADTSSSVLS